MYMFCCKDKVVEQLNEYLFYVGPSMESILLTTVYDLCFSHDYTLDLQITFLHVMWAALVYCINTCLSNLWVLLVDSPFL